MRTFLFRNSQLFEFLRLPHTEHSRQAPRHGHARELPLFELALWGLLQRAEERLRYKSIGWCAHSRRLATRSRASRWVGSTNKPYSGMYANGPGSRTPGQRQW